MGLPDYCAARSSPMTANDSSPRTGEKTSGEPFTTSRELDESLSNVLEVRADTLRGDFYEISQAAQEQEFERARWLLRDRRDELAGLVELIGSLESDAVASPEEVE